MHGGVVLRRRHGMPSWRLTHQQLAYELDLYKGSKIPPGIRFILLAGGPADFDTFQTFS